ncbi:alpha/beta-hydrolase [Dichomitus squalens]|uniref:Alpha/beta-hydrolase n=2 Tax=Dichomitus squalens TaxID=114155 RepID=A0A4V2K9B0_9APHY|nr:alpha/beta-hydrolase [Dichomitus squalens LYAD-421 SS1]EJF62356.1 alpha/beta-hydrolase [Dichomitus squalens LYAD-421 SS1]TBU47246.1 alpha/beta-hydrolase [Dichomitus squalens]TBU63178.1 alpha/beta-hydrolase [Dichomitus squalens]
MDPANPASFNHRTALLPTGRKYHFVDQLPTNYDPTTTTTLVCIHGFPDFWYGWRYQIKPWVELGYRVVAPDKLGYGGSDKPEDAIQYTSRRICDDIAALLDLLQITKAVIIGHDWGCFMASRFALWHPDRLLALVLLSVPFIPPAKEYTPLETLVERYPNWGYQLYFQEKSTNAELENQLSRFFRLIFRNRRGTPGLSKWTLPGGLKALFETAEGTERHTGHLTQEEHDYYLSQFANSMNGPLNYYRTTRYRFEEERDGTILQAPRSDLPVLLMIGKDDPTSNQAALGATKKLIPQAQIELIEGVGHWLMVECKDRINESIPRFLRAHLPDAVPTKL